MEQRRQHEQEQGSLQRTARLKRAIYINTFLSGVGYQVPISVTYLAKWMGYAKSYSYREIFIFHLLIALAIFAYIAIVYFKKNIDHFFADRIFYLQVAVWLCLYVFWTLTLGELRFYGLISAFIVFTFVFSRGGIKPTMLIVCAFTLLHIVTCYFAIHILQQGGDFVYECFLAYQFFLVYLFLAWVGLRIYRQRIELIQSKSRLELAQQDLKQAMSVLKQAALTDPLTGLFNRRAMVEVLETKVSDGKETEEQSVIALCDLDHFKEVNDKFGHEAGDMALLQVAQCLKNSLRKHDYIARWGGEEFLLLIVGVSLCEGEEICNKLRESVSQLRIDYQGQLIGITGSFGLATLSSNKIIKQQIRVADECLYLAKSEGRNCVKTSNQHISF